MSKSIMGLRFSFNKESRDDSEKYSDFYVHVSVKSIFFF